MQISKDAEKRLFTCKDRWRYSRKRAKFRRILPKNGNCPTSPLTGSRGRAGARCSEGSRRAPPSPPRPRRPRDLAAGKPSKINTLLQTFKILQFLVGSFSAVSKRHFGRKYLVIGMRLTAFFKLYKMCTLLHRSKLNLLSTNRFRN